MSNVKCVKSVLKKYIEGIFSGVVLHTQRGIQKCVTRASSWSNSVQPPEIWTCEITSRGRCSESMVQSKHFDNYRLDYTLTEFVLCFGRHVGMLKLILFNTIWNKSMSKLISVNLQGSEEIRICKHNSKIKQK